MVNEESLAAVARAGWGEHFVRPIYDTYGFARIPQTLRYLLTDDNRKGVPFGPGDALYDKYDTVILFFVDALGWRFFEQYAAEHPFLRRIAADGLVCKLMSQFPSTTAAHVTAIHTGLPVGQSGVYEWFYYEPRLDALIAPLLFSYAGEHERGTLARTGVSPSDLFPTQTLYQELRDAGVHSYVFQDRNYAFSPYTATVTDGAKVVPYTTLPEALVTLEQLRAVQKERAYYFLYYDKIDSICHLYGPDSAHVAAEIKAFLQIMEQMLHPSLQRTARRTLFLLTADHAQTTMDPKATIYLDRAIPEARRWMETNRDGRPLVPAGSARDMFLHVKPEYLDEAAATLGERLAGKAEVHRVSDLIDLGFFGPLPLCAIFMQRVGNLVILPYSGESVWWHDQGRFEQYFHGSHGGLTRDEMETLLVAHPYG
ncbi:MAG TPA: alkaline phosphatase family protein [Herpetosiphonaceae bacterium]|nr:alkaline phosphatase family protein [Herpetosiphonaceae bacterium]